MKIKISGAIPKHLMEEMQKDKPSDEASYWAKPGCKHCHGQGEVGTLTTNVGNNNKVSSRLLCVCAARKWKAWQLDWLENRQNKKSESRDNGSGRESLEESFELVRPRLERIDDNIHSLKSEILSLTDRINSLPHHKTLKGVNDRIGQVTYVIEEIEGEIDTQQEYMLKLENQADTLVKQAKDLRRKAINIEQQIVEDRAVIGGHRVSLKKLTEERKVVEKDLSKASHSLAKKRREAESKLSKLEDRKNKILQEYGLGPDVEEGYIQLSDIRENVEIRNIDS
jgi:chromosome segregation ATPase